LRPDGIAIVHLAARVVCAEAVNSAAAFSCGRKFIGSGREVSASAVANAEAILETLFV
jgi:hypothetical protein